MWITGTSSVIISIVQYAGDSDYRFSGVIVWNFFIRIILLEIVMLTLARIRLEFSNSTDKVC